MQSRKAYIADKVFTGNEWLPLHAVVVEGGLIADVLPAASLPADIEAGCFPGNVLVPAFIDLQIYGAGEKLFARHPGPGSLEILQQSNRAGGTAWCLPTVATNSNEVLYQCIDAVRQYWQQGGKGILGLHAEGPWLNHLKRGAHIESLIHPPSLDEVSRILEYGKGVLKMITLAPEICSQPVIDLIRSYGIAVAAGHSNATYAEAMHAFDNGVSAVTHLYNAMSPLQHRSPGLVGAAMDHQRVSASVIPDGHHVDYPAIRIAKKIMQERLFVITDAVTTTVGGFYEHQADGDKYVANQVLSGSALTMYRALQNLVQHVGIDLAEALRMCSLYPARILQMDGQLGKIQPGYKAEILVLREALPGSVTCLL